MFVGGSGEAGKVGSWEGSEVGRWERWEDSVVGRWERWQGMKGGRMVRQKCGRYLVLFKDGGHKMSLRFHLFISDVIKGSKGWNEFKIFFCSRRDGKTLPRPFVSC